MEPTTRVERVTCRLGVVRTEGIPRNPNHLQSHSVTNLTQCDLIRQFRDTARDTGTERMTLPRSRQSRRLCAGSSLPWQTLHTSANLQDI
jgi:hypothetical protein